MKIRNGSPGVIWYNNIHLFFIQKHLEIKNAISFM